MENNEHTPFSQNVFERQSHTTNGQQPRSGVWQDNPTPQRARIASTQPAPRKKETRAQWMHTSYVRSQNRPTAKRKTVHLTLWVRPGVKEELQRIAQQEGVSVSSVGAAFLEQALQQHLHIQHEALLDPIIEKAIRKHLRSYSTRIALLLVRVAFDAGQTRNLVTNILSRQPGVTQPVLEHILNSSSTSPKGKITRSTPQLEELITEVDQWFHEKDTSTNE